MSNVTRKSTKPCSGAEVSIYEAVSANQASQKASVLRDKDDIGEMAAAHIPNGVEKELARLLCLKNLKAITRN